MFVSLKANRKRIIAFILLAAAVVGGCLLMRSRQQEPQPQEAYGETPEERLTFLQSFGWELDPEPTETREVMIPAQFNDVYQNYNAMQQAQGFDLAPYAGEVVTQYKYHITNYPGETEVYATLLVHGRLIIGGDLACSQVNGFMHGFAKDSARYGEATPRPADGSSSAADNDYVNSSSVENSGSGASAAPAQDQSSQPQGSPDGGEAASGAATDAEPEYPTD